MYSSIHFYVYSHVFILQDKRKVTRFFITLRDWNKNIIAFTDFHKYIRIGNHSKSVKVTSSGEVKFYAVCKFLNHVFFESDFKPNSLNDITKEMVSTDIGAYDTCGHLCKYCYANTDAALVKKNMKCHDPKSPFLLGGNLSGDVIHEVVQKSWIDRQMRLEL